MPRRTLPSPVGILLLVEENGVLTELRIGEGPDGRADGGSPFIAETARQLDAYFAGSLRDFDPPLAPAASSFQHWMRAAMIAIPFGDPSTLGDVSARPRNGKTGG